MSVILAIDAAWTRTEPSGVALVEKVDDNWRCTGLAPSYTQFYDLAEDKTVDWSNKPAGEQPNIAQLLNAANRMLSGQTVSLITVDMPVSTIPITGRREAERAISSAFGSRGCAAHSPGVIRPGSIADIYYKGAIQQGFSLGTTETKTGNPMQMLEVYPHPALLKLLNTDYRVPYKQSKHKKYWPDLDAQSRKSRLLDIYSQVLNALSDEIAAIPLSIPADMIGRPFSHFKRFEDALDALICAWVGIEYLNGKATAYGDETAAIWVPS